MTAICGGGTSSAKSGYAASLFMGPSALAAFLNNIPTLWAVPLAAYIGYVTYNLSTFCNSDPPAVPTITALDVINLLNPYNPVLNSDAGAKFQQLIGAYLWYQTCECNTVATPAPPSPLAAPSGMPSVNPPAVSLPIGLQQCAPTQTFTRHNPAPPDAGFSGPVTPIPAGATQVSTTVNWSPIDAFPTVDYPSFLINFTDALGFLTLQDEASWTDSHLPYTKTVAIPSGTVNYQIRINSNNMTSASDLRGTLTFYCGGGTSGTQAPTPCPPDQVTLGLLDQILQLVRLIQRQSVPFAYVSSTAHPGLSGNGHFAVQGLIGCKVELTTVPSNVGVESGDPLSYWEAGWIRWGNADGYEKRVPISASPLVSLPLEAGQYTRIGYTLMPGTVATITELVREA